MTRMRQPSGHAGLGLWIVRRNVEALGGRVGAANRIGGGLSVTISISLPRNRRRERLSSIARRTTT